MKEKYPYSYEMAGVFTLSLRLVVGWTYFSAFWRRLVLTNKLDPEVSGYIGEKFNHFLPNALGIKPLIQHLVENPGQLWWTMVIFTITEGLVGLFIMFGLFTRLMSIGVFGLAIGILLGAGWLGTTCLDEWQIGVLGIATGFSLFFAGGGHFSIDNYLIKAKSKITQTIFFNWLGSGRLPLNNKVLSKIILGGSIAIFVLTLFTNQYFHGGVWGTLLNKSVKPKVEITNPQIQNNSLTFEVFRSQGVDVYGSFLIGIELYSENNQKILGLNGEELARFKTKNIENKHIAKVKPGEHSLIIPLGSKADITIENNGIKSLPDGSYKLVLTDISGVTWERLFKK
jgi:uncharacterized membrane protein YphA (DoxX/SURF4 family)